MSSVVISGDTSGAITVSAPAVSGTNTLTLQAATATNAVNTLGTAVASTSGTSIDFTSLPAWVKRVTVMMQTVSANGTSNWLVQIGAGSIQTTGYTSGSQVGGGGLVTSTAGMILSTGTAALNWNGLITLVSFGSNTWVSSHTSARSDGAATMGGGSVTLSGTLDRLRFTTVNGTDTFDAGSINILYEG